MYSYILKQATVIDGTGKRREIMDVALENDIIANIAPSIKAPAHTVIDAAGKIICPGFIDVQNHSDSYWQLFQTPSLDSLILQGFTTILVGQCGASLAPLVMPGSMSALERWHDSAAMNINWITFAEFAAVMEQKAFGCNVASLVGLDTLKGTELQRVDTALLKRLVAEALAQGAFGLSARLNYSLAAAHKADEDALAEAGQAGGLVSIHIEHESTNIRESVEYIAEMVARKGINAKISHLKLQGRDQWREYEAVVEILDTARHHGANLHFDVYPYDSTWQSLRNYLPQWASRQTASSLAQSLEDPVKRSSLLGHLNSHSSDLRNLIIASTTHNLNIGGKKLGDIARELSLTSEEALFQILRTAGPEILVFDQNLDPAQVWSLAMHPLAMIATDGAGYAVPEQLDQFRRLGGKFLHPRCFGTTGTFLKSLIDQNPDGLEDAIRRLSYLPAQKIGLRQRGSLTVGKKADAVIFDPRTIGSHATMTNPYVHPEGIEQVFVNGVLAVNKGRVVNPTAGRFLKKA